MYTVVIRISSLADKLGVTSGIVLNLIIKQKLGYFRHKTPNTGEINTRRKGQRNRGRPKRSWEKGVEDWMVSGEWDEQQKIG